MAVNYGAMQATIIPGANIEANIGVSGPPSDDYENLRNKPQINGVTLIGDKSNADLGIPTELADLTADETHRTVTDEDIETWNAKSDFSGSYNDLTDVPDDLVEDGDYVHTDNNYTNSEKSKLEGIESGAEANVQSDWEQPDNTADDFIKNKPENLVQDASYVHTDNNYTSTEKTKLSGIAEGAEVNVQSDWSETDNTKDAYIKNKPDLTAYIQKSQTSGLVKNDGSVDTNTYATTSQIPDISGKADKSEMAVTDGTGADADKVTIQLKSGTSAKVLKTHQDISGKVDKVSGKGLSSNDYTTAEKNILASLNTLMGTTNISEIGDGTVTGALDAFANTVVGSFDYDGATGKLYYEAFLGSPYVFSLNNGILSVDIA